MEHWHPVCLSSRHITSIQRPCTYHHGTLYMSRTAHHTSTHFVAWASTPQAQGVVSCRFSSVGSPYHERFAVVLKNVLTPEECTKLIELSEVRSAFCSYRPYVSYQPDPKSLCHRACASS